nr:MAG TPA: hypothetical protein [Caudoviricetes sp.]
MILHDPRHHVPHHLAAEDYGGKQDVCIQHDSHGSASSFRSDFLHQINDVFIRLEIVFFRKACERILRLTKRQHGGIGQYKLTVRFNESDLIAVIQFECPTNVDGQSDLPFACDLCKFHKRRPFPWNSLNSLLTNSIPEIRCECNGF